MRDDPGAILRASNLFGGLDAEALERVRAVSRVVAYRHGETIVREGQPCPGIFVVGKGAVRVFKLAPNGKVHLLHLARAGQSFVEVAVMGGFDCPAHAEALEDTTCALVQRDGFWELLRADHGFCLAMLACVTRRVRGLIARLEDLVLHDAASRVARYLVTAPGGDGEQPFELPLRKKDLASHLNLTSETLSRTLRRLVDDGLIAMEDRRFRVLQRARLADVAEGAALLRA